MFYFVPSFRSFAPSRFSFPTCIYRRFRWPYGGWRGGGRILFKARFTFLRRRHFLPKAPTRIGIRFIYIHIYVHAPPPPLPLHPLVSFAGESVRLVKEINALISLFSATYRPRGHDHPPTVTTPCPARSRELQSETFIRSPPKFHHDGLVVTALCKGSVREGSRSPRLYVLHTFIALR